MNNDNLITMRFVTSFACTGNACPDNCCHDWVIGVEKNTYDDLRRLYGKTPEDKAFFETSLKINQNPFDEHNYAILQNDAKGRCRFLDNEGWCRIHRDYGAEHLGYTCKDYPRIFTDNFELTEIVLSLSCPEAARRFIESDTATELCEAPDSLLQHSSGFRRELPGEESLPPYQLYRNDIRQILMLLAGAEQFPVAGRIFLMLHFARQTAPLFHSGSDESTIEALVREIDAIANPDNHPLLMEQFVTFPDDQARAIGTLLAIILFRLEVSWSTFSDYAAKTLRHYDVDLNTLDDEMFIDAFPPLIVRYLENRDILNRSHKQFLEEQLGKLLSYNCFKQHYIYVDNLLEHVRGILLAVQLVKFLFVLHPSVDALCHAQSDKMPNEEEEQILMDAMIETIFQTARAFDHWGNKGVKLLTEAMDTQGIKTFEQLVQFTKA